MEQVRLVRKTVVGYDLVDYTSWKRPRETAEQWRKFLRSYKTRIKLKESRTPLVGFSSEGKYEHPKGPLESKPLEKVVIYDDYPVQSITIRGNLSAEYRSEIIEILQKHVDAFAWTPADMTGIPSFIAEHELKTYPHIEPRVQRKRSIAPDRRKVVKEEVAEWLKDGIVRRVRYPTWVANPVLIDWKIESLMGFKYKCFLDAYKGYHQIQMTKKDEEKTTFHTDEGVFCYTKMPFGLKNARATYQRLVDTIFEGQIGRNLEAYVDDMVIKSKTELEMIKDIEETLLTLKKVNMKVNPKRCSFGREEGKFLGYIVTFEGIRANPEKEKAIVNMPSPTNLKQMQRLSGKLAALNRFLSKVAEKALPCLDTLKRCTNKKDFHWTTEAEEAYQEMKKLIAELPTLTAPKKEEELMVFLSAASEAVSAVLLVERQGI
ncbi:reverse transcriptase domain-containing protein [Tanacetum coccineum]